MNIAIERGKAGPLFEDFLREQGTCGETTGRVVKGVLAYQLAAAMKEQHIFKVEMANLSSVSAQDLRSPGSVNAGGMGHGVAPSRRWKTYRITGIESKQYAEGDGNPTGANTR